MGEYDLSPEEIKKISRTVKLIGLVIVGALLVFIYSPVVFIGAGERGILMEWGKVKGDPLSPGMNFIIPVVNSIARLDVQTQVYEVEATAASKDLQDAKTKIAVNYHVLPENTNTLYRDVGIGYKEKLIVPAVQEVTKATTAEYTADELITKRSSVKDALQSALSKRLLDRGIIVETISITNFQFSAEFSAAIEQKVTAQQLAKKAEYDLARIEVEAKQKVAAAKGESEAIIAVANGKAEEIKIIQQQLKVSPDYVIYLATRQWDGKLPMVTGSGGVPFITLPQKTQT